MLRRFADQRLASWILAETGRARLRVKDIRTRYPSAPLSEQAERLLDEKKKWASTGGAVSGLFGLATLPLDFALVGYLQLSLIIDLAVLNDRHLKSASARREVLQIFFAANTTATTAAMASPRAVARLAERILSTKGMRFLGKMMPVVAAPITAALNTRALERVSEEAMRYYRYIPHALTTR